MWILYKHVHTRETFNNILTTVIKNIVYQILFITNTWIIITLVHWFYKSNFHYFHEAWKLCANLSITLFRNFYLVSRDTILDIIRDLFLINALLICATLPFMLLVALRSDVLQDPKLINKLPFTSFALSRNISASCFPVLERFMTFV